MNLSFNPLDHPDAEVPAPISVSSSVARRSPPIATSGTTQTGRNRSSAVAASSISRRTASGTWRRCRKTPNPSAHGSHRRDLVARRSRARAATSTHRQAGLVRPSLACELAGPMLPSIATLAADTGLQRRAVQLHLGRLVKRGALVREVRPGRSNALRLDLQALLTSVAAGSSTSPCSTPDQIDGRGRTSCTPPAHVVHPPAHQVHPSCARGAPEVKREGFMKLNKKGGATAAPVDTPQALAQPPQLPWWQSDAGVRSKGVELGLPATPGESSRHYKNRLFEVLHELRSKAQR